MTNLRMTTVITLAVFFLAVGTFTSVSIQGAYQILIAIPMVFYSWRAFGRNFRLPASSWWLIAFSLVALLTVFLNWSDIPKPSKNLGRIKYFLMAAFGIFPMGVWLKHVSDRVKKRLMRWGATAIVVAGAWVVYHRGLLGDAGKSPLTETMRYAYGTALILVLMLTLILQHDFVKSWFSKKWAIPAILFGLLGVVLINSRGAQASLLLALPLILWFWNKKWALVIGLLLGLGGSYVAWNYFYGKSNDSKVRILSNSQNNSDFKRRSQWQAAFIAWKERPVLGWGFSNFSTQLKRIKEQYDLPAKEYNDAHAHNVLLEIAAGTGFIGLVFFLGWFFTWAWECWRMGGLVRSLMMPFFVAIAFQAQFEVILDANNATWISFLYALTLSLDRRYQLSFA